MLSVDKLPSKADESWTIHYEELRQTEFKVRHLASSASLGSRRDSRQAQEPAEWGHPHPLFVFRINGSLVVRAAVTHSGAREKHNPSPAVGGKDTDRSLHEPVAQIHNKQWLTESLYMQTFLCHQTANLSSKMNFPSILEVYHFYYLQLNKQGWMTRQCQ